MLGVLPSGLGTIAYHIRLRSAIAACAAYRLASVFIGGEMRESVFFSHESSISPSRLNIWVSEEKLRIRVIWAYINDSY